MVPALFLPNLCGVCPWLLACNLPWYQMSGAPDTCLCTAPRAQPISFGRLNHGSPPIQQVVPSPLSADLGVSKYAYTDFLKPFLAHTALALAFVQNPCLYERVV